MDIVSKQRRSEIMASIKGKDTKPEKKVRSLLHRMGYRFRLHKKTLPGKPDITMKKYKTVIFVNGCFWHQHPGCKDSTTPKSNIDFWGKKLHENVERDMLKITKLKDLDWNVLIIWECETEKAEVLENKIRKGLPPVG
jgi:DNA mismatch endonuclease (patch repair protein)